MSDNERLHKVFKKFPNQDLLAQVTIPCDKCGGTGEIPDKRTLSTMVIDRGSKTCPSCEGRKTRRITRLQQIMEGRGEWVPFFLWWVDKCSHVDGTGEGYVDKFTLFDILDANKLGAAVLEWKEAPTHDKG